MPNPPATRRERSDRSSRDEPTMAVRLGAEAIGTFALTFVAAGGDAMARVSGGEVSTMARAIAPGLLVMAFIYAIGDRSGAHFNPAVTLAFTIRRLFPVRWTVPYWIAQLLGAIAAGLVLVALFGSDARAGVSTPHVAAWVALTLEVILTMFLVLVILGTADRFEIIGANAAIAVGATIALCGLIALPIEGASMNPARSLGPALATGSLGDVWIYVLGPVLGGLVAVGLATFLHGPATPADRKPSEAARGQG